MLEEKQILQQRYQLKQKIAQNAGRQTWLAEDISIQPAETVILKFLSFGEQFQWQDLKLFEREAEILKQLSHHRIPKYRDSFSLEDNHNWFALVEEYIPGESLKQLIEKKQRFTEDELRKIAQDVLEILCYLHTLNPLVIHRDIKPSNLIIGEDKKVYLIDFGAVQDSAAAQGATFTVVGTYGYAPIEQFGGRTVPASDLYALGATLIHLATGRIPADLPQKKMRIQFQDKVSLSDNFINWIEKLTEPDIEDRFTIASEALEALNSRFVVNLSQPSEALNNRVISSPTTFYKPYGSKIKLKKSSNQLNIKIPARETNFFDLCKIILGILFLSFFYTDILNKPFTFPIIVLPFIGFLVYSSIVLFPAFAELYLRFNQNDFILEWKLFSFTYRKNCGKTSTIHYVTISDAEFNEKKFKTISLHAGVKKYNFSGLSPKLTDIEREWLIEEIKNWLGIS